jgi:hypothetical protein
MACGACASRSRFSPHIGGELFNLLAGTRDTHVPYRGGAPIQ